MTDSLSQQNCVDNYRTCWLDFSEPKNIAESQIRHRVATLCCDLASDPFVAAKIAVEGLANDLFTGAGRKLANTLPGRTATRNQYMQARSFVNGTNRAGHIADIAIGYENAIRGNCP